MAQRSEDVRLLTTHDIPALERLLYTSEYIYQRFTREELPLLLQHAPAVGYWHDVSLHGFLLSQSLNAPSAWIGGFRRKLDRESSLSTTSLFFAAGATLP